MGRAMIGFMGRPFRFDKKERKRLRRRAKKEAIAADKFEAEGTKQHAVAVLRRLAEFNTRMARAKRGKKKSKKPN